MLSEAVAALEREVGKLRSENASQAHTIAEQDHVIDVLKGALAASGSPDVHAFCIERLSEQQAALVGVLLHAKPGVFVQPRKILDLLPSRDHIVERNEKQVMIVVRRIRVKLGQSVIQNARGKGYRLSEAFRASLTHG